MRLGHAEIDQQKRHRLGRHHRAAIGMDSELIANDALLGEGLGNKLLRQCCSFTPLVGPPRSAQAKDL